MAKFAVIQLRDYVSIDKETFQKKYKASELKKQFKCKKIHELKSHKKDNYKEAELSKISEYDLNLLSRNLVFTDLDDLSGYSLGLKETTKIFIFSEDACSSVFAFEHLKNDKIVKLFTLTDQNINEFLYYLNVIQSVDDTILSLNDAKNQCKSLGNIEYDLNLSLLESDAIESIESKISEVVENLLKSKEYIEDLFNAQWK